MPGSFTPLAWQVVPWQDYQSKVMVLTGSAGGGKSWVAAEKIHAYCKAYAGSTAVVLRKTREAMKNSTLLFLKNAVIGDDPSVVHVKSEHRFEYANGSVLVYGGMKDEAQREQIRSIGLTGGVDIAWLEEANKFLESDFNEVLARMRGHAAPWRQVILTTNPDSKYHWINQRLILGNGATTYFSKATDNYHNDDSYIETLKNLTGIQRVRLYEGKWEKAEGLVYDAFDFNRHVMNAFSIPHKWKRYRVIDFGLVNPFVCQWWAQSPDNKLYLYRELYQTDQIVEDHAKVINRYSFDETFEFTLADHDAEDRKTLERHGIATTPAKKDISAGIQAVKNRLRVNRETGEPGMFVFSGARLEPVDENLLDAKYPTCTEEEFGGYVWAQTPEGKALKEVPVDLHNHGMDCVRYMMMSLDGGAVGASVTSVREYLENYMKEKRPFSERTLKYGSRG